MELSNPFQASWFQILKYILIRRPKDLLGLQELVVGQNQQQVLCFWIKMKDDVALNIFFCSLKSKEESTFFTLFVWDMKILIFTKELPYYQSLLLRSFRSENTGWSPKKQLQILSSVLTLCYIGCFFSFCHQKFWNFFVVLIIPNFYEDCTKINSNIRAIKYQS